MIQFRDEGEPLAWGLNIYPRNSNHFGFIFSSRSKRLSFRYSRLSKIWQIYVRENA
jgi:hypothetical protein